MERLGATHVANEDALYFIERWDSPQTLFYIDPPYPMAEQGHYDGYRLEDFAALCELLDTCQGSYILSNYGQSAEPKSAQQRIEISAHCSSSRMGKAGANRDKSRAATSEELGDRKRTEVLWICDRSANIRPDLIEIARRNAPRFIQPEPELQQLPQLSLFDLSA
jgi:hypothetical protein